MILYPTLIFLYELFLVIIVFLFGTILSCMVAQFILQNINMFNSKKNSIILIISIILYLSIIVFVLFNIRLTLKNYILNDGLVDSGFFIVGPIIGIFLFQKIFVKKLIKKYLKNT
jgi:hypothetical protein